MSTNGRPNGLPASWTRVQLGDIGVVHCGQSPPTAAVNKEGRGTPYVTGPEQWDGARLHMDKWTTEPKRMAPAGSVFVTVKGAGVGTVFPGVAAAIGRDVYAFEPKAGISPSFVEHALRFTVQDVIRHAVGDIPGLSKSHITDHWIGLPPREEQQLIVAAIESYFSRLDAATATLERMQRNLERYRASVLKAAVEGRLVPTEAELAKKEGRTYEPASTLLKRILTERRRRWEEAELAKLTAKGKKPADDKWKAKYEEPAAPDVSGLPELPEGWCWASVDQVTAGDRMSAYGVLVPGPDVADGVLFVRVGDIDEGRIDQTGLKRIDRQVADQFRKTYLRGGEVLLTLVGTIGRAAVVPEVLAGANVARAVGVIPPCSLVSPSWLVTWLRSPMTRARMVGKSHEVARKTLNLEDVRTAPVALPPHAEHARVVESVADLDSLAEAAEKNLLLGLQRITRLRQSILKWAFEGRLVGPVRHGR